VPVKNLVTILLEGYKKKDAEQESSS